MGGRAVWANGEPISRLTPTLKDGWPLPSLAPSLPGYKIMGPGCGGPGEAKKCIMAQYPCPEMVSTLNPTSLDYHPPEANEEGDK